MFLSKNKIYILFYFYFFPDFNYISAEARFPANVTLAINHCIFVMGDQTNFDIEPAFGVEASELYPDVEYTSVDEYLDQFA